MSPISPLLLPVPRHLHINGETTELASDKLIVIPNHTFLFEGQAAQRALQNAGLSWEIVAGNDYIQTGLHLYISNALEKPQSYTLKVVNGKIDIQGADTAGVFYGLCTLQQLLQQYGRELPAIFIEDWPDFAARGVMMDVSRDRVPTMENIYRLIDLLASWKINEFQLYMEHTFAYKNHREIWADASPFTGQEILELDVYCRQRHVNLVPNQNSLGHMERWLRHKRYIHLAECPDGFISPWHQNKLHEPTTLNPLDPATLKLIIELYDELLPHFTSDLFNVGCDEPWELGKGKSKTAVEMHGGSVYLDYLRKLYKEVTKHGRRMQFWADIIVHYPDLVPELPADAIAMIWGYEADQPKRDDCEMVARAGIASYVVPGTSSWNSIAGRTDNTLANLLTAARNGREFGSIGFLNTVWGDNGHWQPFSADYLSFAYGAGVSWYMEGNEGIDLPAVLNRFVFRDHANVMGQLVYDLGNVYQLAGPPNRNGQLLAYMLQRTRDEFMETQEFLSQHDPDHVLTIDNTRQYIQQLNTVIANLPKTNLDVWDGDIIKLEYAQAANLLRHSAKRTLTFLGEPVATPVELLAELENLIEQQKSNWLARNRKGGLRDSLKRFEHLISEYRNLIRE